jgi:hypothetical protein
MYEIKTSFDEFEQTTSYQLVGNVIENNGGWQMDLMSFLYKDKKFSLSINIVYMGVNYININNTQPLALLLDHVRYDFDLITDPSIERFDEETVYESAIFKINESTLDQIISAKERKMRIYGNGYHDFDLTEKTLKGLIEFNENIVKKYFLPDTNI